MRKYLKKFNSIKTNLIMINNLKIIKQKHFKFFINVNIGKFYF